MRYIAILFLFFTANAVAQQVCPPTGDIPVDAALLCWVNATLDVNDNPLPATGPGALNQTRIQRAQVAAGANCSFTTIAQTLNVTPDVIMVFLENLTPGKHCFRLRHIANGTTTDTMSDWTATSSKVTTAPTPPPARPRPGTITIY